MATVTNLGPCDCCPQVVTVVCDGDAVEVDEQLEVEFSNGTGAAACLNGLIYDLDYQLTGSENHWYNPPGPAPMCLCVDQFAHYLDFRFECIFNAFFSQFSIVGTGGGSTPPPCGYTGPAYLYSASSAGSFTGTGSTFEFTQSLSSSNGGGTVDVTVRPRS